VRLCLCRGRSSTSCARSSRPDARGGGRLPRRRRGLGPRWPPRATASRASSRAASARRSRGDPRRERARLAADRLRRDGDRGRRPPAREPGRTPVLDARIFGGFTTFSSFSLQTLSLVQEGEWLQAGATSRCRSCCASSECGSGPRSLLGKPLRRPRRGSSGCRRSAAAHPAPASGRYQVAEKPTPTPVPCASVAGVTPAYAGTSARRFTRATVRPTIVPMVAPASTVAEVVLVRLDSRQADARGEGVGGHPDLPAVVPLGHGREGERRGGVARRQESESLPSGRWRWNEYLRRARPRGVHDERLRHVVARRAERAPGGVKRPAVNSRPTTGTIAAPPILAPVLRTRGTGPGARSPRGRRSAGWRTRPRRRRRAA